MRSYLAVVPGFVCAAGLPVSAFAQAGTEQPAHVQIQALKEMHKPYDVKTAQSLPTSGGSKTTAAATKREPIARPEVVQFPGYKGPSGPSK